MRLSSIITSIALVGALALVSACVAEVPPVVIETPSPTPTVSVDPSPSASPSPSPTREGLSTEELLEILPEDADIPDIRGAIAVATFYIDLRDQLFSDPLAHREVWVSLATENCGFCAESLEQALDSLERGESRVGGDVSIPERPSDAGLDRNDPTLAYVQFWIHQDELTVFDDSGAEIRTVERATIQVEVQLQLRDGLWFVDGIATTVISE